MVVNGKVSAKCNFTNYFSLFEIAANLNGNSNNSKPIICVEGNL
jgi:hypothetical protein